MNKQPNVDVRELLKAGAHFGHKVSRWNPKMKPYIFGVRGGIYIIDLVKTADELTKALDFVSTTVASGKQVLFVATKRHLREAVRIAAESANMPYITERWFGGTLTNFGTISKRVKYLKDLEEKLASGKLAETHSKRELGEVKEEMAKLNAVYSGLKDMAGLPGAVFAADVITDDIAIKEASRLGIPIIGIVDTNSDPSLIDYPVPANDDAVSTVTLISNLIAEAVKHGKSQVKKEVKTEDAVVTDKKVEDAKIPASVVTKAKPPAKKKSTDSSQKTAKAETEQNAKSKKPSAKAAKPKKAAK